MQILLLIGTIEKIEQIDSENEINKATLAVHEVIYKKSCDRKIGSKITFYFNTGNTRSRPLRPHFQELRKYKIFLSYVQSNHIQLDDSEDLVLTVPLGSDCLEQLE